MKRKNLLLNLLGLLILVPCLLGLVGGIITVSQGNGNSETRMICLALVCGVLLGLGILLRKKLFRRKAASQRSGASAAEPGTGSPRGGKGPYLLAVLGLWLGFGGVFLLLSMGSVLIVIGRTYREAGPILLGAGVGLLMLALGIWLLAAAHRKAAKNGRPLSKGFRIGAGVFLGIAAIVMVTTYSTVHHNVPAPNLDAAQKADLSLLAEEKGFLALTPSPESQEQAPRSGLPWLAIRLPGYESLEKAEPVAWSEAWLGTLTGWQRIRPTAQSLDGVEVLVLCRYGLWKASYGKETTLSPGRATSLYEGTSEYVKLYYIDLSTGEVFLTETIGTQLPKTAVQTPHYKLSEEDLAAHIRRQLGTK